jgi:hypothetical protein
MYLPKIIKNNKNKNTTLSEQFQNKISKIVERGKIDSTNTEIHDRSLCWLSTGT